MATQSFLRRSPYGFIVAAVVQLLAAPLSGAEAKTVKDQLKEIAGTSEFLRSVPKHFATLKGVDAARQRVTLLLDGEKLPKVWSLAADAEIKVSGWWGRLDDFTLGDRVWAWFATNRAGQPVSVFMLADELSEQDIHGAGVILTSVAKGKVTMKAAKGTSRVLKTDKARGYRAQTGASKRQKMRVPVKSFEAGAKVYVQSAGDDARLILDFDAFAVQQAEQKAALRKHWLEKGLPGTVVFLHLSGEMDYMLDHEAMRWGRSLKPGDKVSLQVASPITAVVKRVRPWRERTQLQLVVKGDDLADLSLGQRVGLKMKAPSAVVENGKLPPDLGRLKTKPERVEWFLASIYCSCPVEGDVCTGHFYTLASCNPNACNMPNHMRKQIAAKIDKGLTDRQIFEELLKQNGPDLLRQHLAP